LPDLLRRPPTGYRQPDKVDSPGLNGLPRMPASKYSIKSKAETSEHRADPNVNPSRARPSESSDPNTEAGPCSSKAPSILSSVRSSSCSSRSRVAAGRTFARRPEARFLDITVTPWFERGPRCTMKRPSVRGARTVRRGPQAPAGEWCLVVLTSPAGLFSIFLPFRGDAVPPQRRPRARNPLREVGSVPLALSRPAPTGMAGHNDDLNDNQSAHTRRSPSMPPTWGCVSGIVE
jgi:hypothetical protein